jgi:hypothetical protein
MRADDAFWAARLVARFGDETIRAIVAKAGYSEPGAAEHIVKTLITRRDKVLRAWLTAVNPVTEPRLGADGALTFENAAVSAGVAGAPTEYVLAWSRFDNATGSTTGASEEARVTEPRAMPPRRLLDGSEFVSVAVRTIHPEFPHWRMPATLTFRRTADGWQAVGLDRVVPPLTR